MAILFVEQEALTSLPFGWILLCLPKAILLLCVLEMRSSCMQVKPAATQQCSVSVHKLIVFVHVSFHGLLCVFASVLDMGVKRKVAGGWGYPSCTGLQFSSKHSLKCEA